MTPLGAVPAGMTCPACGVAAPAAARFCPACGERLAGGLEERRVVTVLFAERALDRATAMGAHALVRRLTQAEEVGR